MDGTEPVDDTCVVKTLDVVMTEPAPFVVVIAMISVDASDVEPSVRLFELPVSMVAEPTGTDTITPKSEVAEVVAGEAGAAGTKPVNVVESVIADPAELVKVVTKTVVAVLSE